MKSDGCYEAHSMNEDGTLKYDCGLDKRYKDDTLEKDYDIQYELLEIEGCLGYSDADLKKIQAAKLLNGMILFTQQGKWNWPVLIIDINGHNGPNKWGHDLFVFTIKYDNTNNSNWRFDPGDDRCERKPEKGGWLTKDILLENN